MLIFLSLLKEKCYVAPSDAVNESRIQEPSMNIEFKTTFLV